MRRENIPASLPPNKTAIFISPHSILISIHIFKSFHVVIATCIPNVELFFFSHVLYPKDILCGFYHHCI